MSGKYREKPQSECIQNNTEHSMTSLLYIKQIYIKQTTKYDYTTKPQAVIQNYFKKQLYNRETKHCYKTRCNQ